MTIIAEYHHPEKGLQATVSEHNLSNAFPLRGTLLVVRQYDTRLEKTFKQKYMMDKIKSAIRYSGAQWWPELVLAGICETDSGWRRF